MATDPILVTAANFDSLQSNIPAGVHFGSSANLPRNQDDLKNIATNSDGTPICARALQQKLSPIFAPNPGLESTSRNTTMRSRRTHYESKGASSLTAAIAPVETQRGHAVSAGHRHSSSSKSSTIRSGSTSTVRVRGYTKRDGTHIESHRRTKVDDTDLNNWSTKGNVNPDTGKMGTKTPRDSNGITNPSYSSNQTIPTQTTSQSRPRTIEDRQSPQIEPTPTPKPKKLCFFGGQRIPCSN